MGYWRNLMRAAFAAPLRALSGYEAAANTRRTQGWNPANEGINALVAGGGDPDRKTAPTPPENPDLSERPHFRPHRPH